MPVVCNFVKEFNLKNAVKYSIMLSTVGAIAEESRAECNFLIFREKKLTNELTSSRTSVAIRQAQPARPGKRNGTENC